MPPHNPHWRESPNRCIRRCRSGGTSVGCCERHGSDDTRSTCREHRSFMSSRRRVRTLGKVWHALRRKMLRNRRLVCCCIDYEETGYEKDSLDGYVRSCVTSQRSCRVYAHMNAETHRSELSLRRVQRQYALRRLEYVLSAHCRRSLSRAFCSWRVATLYVRIFCLSYVSHSNPHFFRYIPTLSPL